MYKNVILDVVSKSSNGRNYEILQLTLPTGYKVDIYDFKALEKVRIYKQITDNLGIE